MSRLALIAMLLLLLVPGTGRVLAAPATGAESGMAMCTGGGLELVPASRTDHGDPAPSHPRGGMHEDCSYCPLLGSLTLATATAPAVPAAAGPVRIAVPQVPHRAVWRHPNGLGSRGPPHS